jgi:tRNA A37 methylthiotransferase MiaB
LAGFEKNIVLQYRQEQATRDQILMEMVNDAVKGEKEKELELKILRRRNEKLEKMVNGGQ